jgi:hypothetical protein
VPPGTPAALGTAASTKHSRRRSRAASPQRRAAPTFQTSIIGLLQVPRARCPDADRGRRRCRVASHRPATSRATVGRQAKRQGLTAGGCSVDCQGESCQGKGAARGQGQRRAAGAVQANSRRGRVQPVARRWPPRGWSSSPAAASPTGVSPDASRPVTVTVHRTRLWGRP